jgi:hypothetical protein
MTFGLSFDGQPVDGHNLSWSIPKFTDYAGQVINNPDSDYGLITQSDYETSQDGKANAKYRTSFVSGAVTFTIIDQTALSTIN